MGALFGTATIDPVPEVSVSTNMVFTATAEFPVILSWVVVVPVYVIVQLLPGTRPRP